MSDWLYLYRRRTNRLDGYYGCGYMAEPAPLDLADDNKSNITFWVLVSVTRFTWLGLIFRHYLHIPFPFSCWTIGKPYSTMVFRYLLISSTIAIGPQGCKKSVPLVSAVQGSKLIWGEEVSIFYNSFQSFGHFISAFLKHFLIKIKVYLGVQFPRVPQKLGVGESGELE